MYSYIKGILTDMDEESIVVETGGIGYHIYTTDVLRITMTGP